MNNPFCFLYILESRDMRAIQNQLDARQMDRWDNELVNRLGSDFALHYRVICACSARKPGRLLPMIAPWVHYGTKSRT
jgi:Tfp pilus assembly protein PilV